VSETAGAESLLLMLLLPNDLSSAIAACCARAATSKIAIRSSELRWLKSRSGRRSNADCILFYCFTACLFLVFEAVIPASSVFGTLVLVLNKQLTLYHHKKNVLTRPRVIHQNATARHFLAEIFLLLNQINRSPGTDDQNEKKYFLACCLVKGKPKHNQK